MDGKVTQVTVVVTDLDRALKFYTEKAGFEKKSDVALPDGHRWVTVGLKDQDLEFALWGAGSPVDPAQREWSRRWAPATSPPVVIRVADCRRAYEELSARGVPFPQPPKDYPWGTSATFADPDGNLFSLSQPPQAWPRG